MDRQQARNLIKETFEKPFDKARFTAFIKNLLNRSEDAPFTYKGQYIPEAYRTSISALERIAKFTDGDRKIDVLIIRLKKETSLERARTMQRNFVAWYLNGSRGGELKDAALVAFVSPDETDWRFSLVKMDYKFEPTSTGKMKVKEEFTPARRWSFLVGVSEKSHTAQSRLISILANDEQSPTLAALEEAFNIETVTNEFFLKYRDLFVRAKEALDKVIQNDPGIKADLQTRGVNTVDFAKKLLGQIVFLYFLQKKGWFGVKGNDKWGDGSKQFLRELFDGKHGTYKNFFNDILEPLFYDALSRDRSDIDHWNDHFKCKIPFLNGGLFDPIGNYSWHSADILLPNELFSNRKSQMDEGTGILDIFDLYNFTVKEDEPMEKEVAIDPELLGKAYEKFNAIRPDNFEEYKTVLTSGKKGDESRFNKQFGVFYTPREIVHYMCQQSLINYLATQLADCQLGETGNQTISKEDIETLIHFGEQVSMNEARVESRGTETTTYSYKLPECIRENAEIIDQKLADITVCDPAVGSGAFPVGMMSEIVKTRNVLSIFIQDKQRTVYDFKRRCIQHSLYGVDIDPGAVEIAKLRLWLSLVVDEDDIRQIKPLPNLDYKIMQGNSLLEDFEGIKLFDEKLIADVDFNKQEQIESLKQKQSALQREYFELHSGNKLTDEKQLVLNRELKKISTMLKKLIEPASPIINASLFDSINAAKQKAKQLRLLHKEFFETTDKKKKDEIKKQIAKLEWELIEVTLGEEGKTAELKKLEELKKSNIKPFFLWKLNFTEVFQDKGGFDVVIANPPYVRADEQSDWNRRQREQILASKLYETLWEKWDLYVPFIEKGFKLLNAGGITTFIVSDAFCHSKYAQKPQKWFLQHSRILRLDFCRDLQIFDAGVHNLIYFFQKADGGCNIPERRVHAETFGNVVTLPSDEQANLTYRAFFPEDAAKQVLECKTLSLGDICYISYGLRPNSDEKESKGEFTTADVVSETRDRVHCKPYVEGKHLGPWVPMTNLWIEWGTARAPSRFCRPTFPELYTVPEKLLAQRSPGPDPVISYDDQCLVFTPASVGFVQWCALQGVRNNSLKKAARYRNEKPPRPDLPMREDLETTSRRFVVKYLLAVMNSTVARDYLRANRRSNIHLYPDDWKKLPIPDVDAAAQAPIVKLVDNILSVKAVNSAADISVQEQEIDRMVYKLYGLAEEEVKTVKA